MAARKKEPKASAPNEGAHPQPLEQLPFVREGRTLEHTFTELEREGKACLYELLKAAVGKMPRMFFTDVRRKWNGELRAEHGDLLKHFLRDGGTVVYGTTFQCAKRKWDAEVRTAPPRQLTDEERRNRIEIPEGGATIVIRGGRPSHIHVPQPGIVQIGASPEMGSTVQLENLFTYWIEEFTAEVEKAVETFIEEPDAPAKLQRIINAIGSFEVGVDGSKILVSMRADAVGRDLLEKFERAKNRSISRLDEIRKEHSTGPIGPIALDKRFEWGGSIASFACIMQDAVAKGWINLPSDCSWDEFAERSRTLFYFHGNKGKEASLGSVKEAMNKVDGGVAVKWVGPLKALPPVNAYRGRGGGKAEAEVSTGTPQK